MRFTPSAVQLYPLILKHGTVTFRRPAHRFRYGYARAKLHPRRGAAVQPSEDETMEFKRNLLTLTLAAAVATIPAFAAPPPAQTHNLLQKINLQAQSTELDASRMYSYSWDQLDWMAQGLQLTTLKGDINTLGREVHWLQTEGALTPDQQIMVSRIARRVNLMANDTEDAILFGSAHRDQLWKLGYQKDVGLLYSNASRLVHETRRALRPEA